MGAVVRAQLMVLVLVRGVVVQLFQYVSCARVGACCAKEPQAGNAMAAGEQATARLSNFGRRWWLWAGCSRVSRGCSAGAQMRCCLCRKRVTEGEP
jgi:hypothetical protein